MLSGSRTVAGRELYLGRLGDDEVILVASGISMVNAAMTAQAALDHFDVSGVLFSGIAGGVDPALGVGDVAVPDRWGQYQEQRFARQTGEGWDPGPRERDFPNFGMMFPEAVQVRSPETGETERRFWFEADPTMLAAARRVAGQARLGRCTEAGRCLERQPSVRVGGRGVSGPTFVDNAAYREWVRATFEADVLDKESAAVAHVAWANQVPFVAFRSLSDLAGGSAGPNEIATFRELAGGNSAALVLAFLQEWDGGIRDRAERPAPGPSPAPAPPP